MNQAIPKLAGAAFRAYYKHSQDKKRSKKSAKRPKWSYSALFDLSLNETRAAVEAYLERTGGVAAEQGQNCTLFMRGDTTITRLPTDREISWGDVPLWITVACANDNGATFCILTFMPALHTYVGPEAIGDFERLSREESAEIAELLANLTQESNRPPEREHVADIANDLSILGLPRGASWEQIQAAYREASRKYHPDRLCGQNIEPHLVELAEQRFKEVSASYQRLRANQDQ